MSDETRNMDLFSDDEMMFANLTLKELIPEAMPFEIEIISDEVARMTSESLTLSILKQDNVYYLQNTINRLRFSTTDKFYVFDLEKHNDFMDAINGLFMRHFLIKVGIIFEKVGEKIFGE